MKNYSRKILLLLLMWGISLCFIPIDAASQSLKINQYLIQAEVQNDGSVEFSEEMTFEAMGSYNGVFYNLDYQQVEEPTDVRVEWKQSDQSTRELSKTASGEDGTYEVSQEDGFLQYKVYIPFTNTTRTVIFHYTLPHLITNYNDTAELNRRVVGANWEIPQENISVHIRLPEAASQETLRAWGHGGEGNVEIDSDYQGVTFTVASNNPGNFVEAHVIFPETITAQNPNRMNESAFERIVTQEETLIQDAQRQQALGIGIVMFSGVLSVIATVMAWFGGLLKNRKRLSQVPFVPEHLFELPDSLLPAVMDSAIYNHVDMDDFSATVMDLVRKKVLQLDGEDIMTLTLLPHTQKLKKYESYVLEMFFRKISKSNTIQLDEISTYAKRFPKKYQQMMDRWMEYVEEESEPYTVTNFSEGESRAQNPWAVVAIVIADGLFLVGAILAGFSMLQWFLGLVIGLCVTILTIYMSGVGQTRRSLEGEYHYRQWNAFRQMLVDLSSLDRAEVASIQIWDHLLVYAIAFGIAKEVIQVLTTQFPEVMLNSEFYSPTSGWQWMVYQQAITNTMTTSYETVQASVSSTSNHGGFGGGFSGGSSMGSGGASGGGGF